jgi:fibronectin type 3 domain-containing protein
MKRIVLAMVMVLMMVSVSMSATLNLKATWTANTESDMKEYRIYRTDGGRVLIGTIQHPTTQYLFNVTIPDQSVGDLTFVMTAVDTAGNQSGDSAVAHYPFNLDTTPPSAPIGITVVKQ